MKLLGAVGVVHEAASCRHGDGGVSSDRAFRLRAAAAVGLQVNLFKSLAEVSTPVGVVGGW